MKIKVAVVALHKVDGSVRPLWIIWDNHSKFHVDKILSIQRVASLKSGGVGMRYLCRIEGRNLRYLYYENPTWFVEKVE